MQKMFFYAFFTQNDYHVPIAREMRKKSRNLFNAVIVYTATNFFNEYLHIHLLIYLLFQNIANWMFHI